MEAVVFSFVLSLRNLQRRTRKKGRRVAAA
jgi:hypothetical protein